MAEITKIEWADSTFNPWIGCTKVSPACDNCYAQNLMDRRMGKVKWGAGSRASRSTMRASGSRRSGAGGGPPGVSPRGFSGVGVSIGK